MTRSAINAMSITLEPRLHTPLSFAFQTHELDIQDRFAVTSHEAVGETIGAETEFIIETRALVPSHC